MKKNNLKVVFAAIGISYFLSDAVLSMKGSDLENLEKQCQYFVIESVLESALINCMQESNIKFIQDMKEGVIEKDICMLLMKFMKISERRIEFQRNSYRDTICKGTHMEKAFFIEILAQIIEREIDLHDKIMNEIFCVAKIIFENKNKITDAEKIIVGNDGILRLIMSYVSKNNATASQELLNCLIGSWIKKKLDEISQKNEFNDIESAMIGGDDCPGIAQSFIAFNAKHSTSKGKNSDGLCDRRQSILTQCCQVDEINKKLIAQLNPNIKEHFFYISIMTLCIKARAIIDISRQPKTHSKNT